MTDDRQSPHERAGHECPECAQTDRAVEHCAGEIWEAGRAFLAAAQVNSGQPVDVVVPDWRSLPEDDRYHFIGEAAPLFSALAGVVVHVSEVSAR